MGGNVVINYVLQKKHNIQGVIASSPFLKLAFQPPKFKLVLGKILQKIAPATTLGNELNPTHLSRDISEVEKYKDDELNHNKISPNFSLTFIDKGQWAIDNAHQLSIPMMLFHGTDDKIIDYKGSQEFVNHSEKAKLKLYEDGYHELHNDLCKKDMLLDVVNWLNSQL